MFTPEQQQAFDAAVQVGEAYNLSLFHTGGGCTALGRMGDSIAAGGSNADSRVHHLLVTDSEDPCVPLDPRAPCVVGWYDEEGDCILQVTLPNFADAMRALDFGPDTIPADLIPDVEVPTWTADEFWAAERYQGGAK